jgi:polyisoprenoid-binding protein YceI
MTGPDEALALDETQKHHARGLAQRSAWARASPTGMVSTRGRTCPTRDEHPLLLAVLAIRSLVVFRAGTHRVGGDDGTLQVRTYREGLAQKVGHDLILDVAQWGATAEVGEDGTLSAVQLNADPRSLQVREGLRGVKALTDKDRADIRKTIDEKILAGRPIAFRSTAIEHDNGGLTVRGELELAGTTRPASFELTAAEDGRLHGTLPVSQSEWGIKPYRGMMGALKVRDTVEVVLDVPLPSA